MSDPQSSSEAEGKVARIITGTSVISAALGVVLSPIPLADELLLLPVYGVMSARIGAARGLSLRELPWRPIAAATVAGLGARAALNVAFAFIPGVAAVANAVSGAALTRLLGRYVDGACLDPANAAPLGVKEISEMLRQSRKGEAAAG